MSIICSELHRLLDGLHHNRFPFNEGSIPSNGIYFLFEEGETAHGTNRIVRVGTHRGQNRLASRLIEHFINENKDRSIFRKNIGRALLTKTDDPFLEKWESDLTTREARYLFESTADMQYQQFIETQVTEVIRSTFSFVVIPFTTYEDRHLFEKKQYLHYPYAASVSLLMNG